MANPTPTSLTTDRSVPSPATESTAQTAVSRFLSIAETASWSWGRHVFLDEKEDYLSELNRWCALYPPTTERQCAAIDGGIHSSLKRRRLERSELARVELLTRCGGREWDLEQKDAVRGLERMLWFDPAAAVRGLEQSGTGCRWMIDGWIGLARTWHEAGTWYGRNCVKAIALQGFKAAPDALAASEAAYLTRLYSLLARPAVAPGKLAALLAPEAMPESLHGAHLLNPLPSPSESHGRITAIIDRELERLRDREARLRVDIEEPVRAAAVRRAVEGDARLESMAVLKRYYDESLASIHKSLTTLVRVIERKTDRMTCAAGTVPDPARMAS